MHGFAYLYERFPSFVQTFVYREAAEMARQGMAPALISIRRPDDPAEAGSEFREEVFYLPPEKELRAEVDRRRETGELRGPARSIIPKRRAEADSQRMFEAAWLAPELRRRGIRHVHAHFAGMAARTAWWLRRFSGLSFSFTGHANDLFCESHFPVSLEDLVRDASLVVTETEYASAWLEQKFPRARGKTRRVFNGVAIEQSIPWSPAEDPPLILSVGRAVEKKGFDVLIDACARLRDRGARFRCEIVGGGPLEEQLRAQIAGLNLEGCVALLGPMPQSEVRLKVARCAVFALACVPERDGGSDNLPTVVMEAMAAGAPVVSTRLAGVPEMVQSGVDGLLVAPRDPAALADALQRILSDEPFARGLGGNAHKTAEARFAVQTTTRELKQLLAELPNVRIPPAALSQDKGLGGLCWKRWRKRFGFA